MTKKKKKAPASPMASPAVLVAPAAPSLQDNAFTTQLPPSPVAASGRGNLMRAGTSSSPAARTVPGSAATVTSATVTPALAPNIYATVAGQKTGNYEKCGKFSKHVDGASGKAWTSFFKDNRSASTGALLPQVDDGVNADKIYFDIKEFEDETQVPTSLVGFFSPKFPGIESVQNMVNTWKHKCKVSRHLSSWIVFTFPSKEDALGVLESGPYLVSGNMLHLRVLPKFFCFGKDEQLTVPAWVQFHNLPLEFWKPQHLGKLCSFIGRPLHTDRLTDSRERISFARCLIDVTAGSDLPNHLPVELSDGTKWCQPVLYENIPLFCTTCKGLGHASTSCRISAEPTLYVMKKPMKRAEKPKVVKKKVVNPASAPKDVWVEVGKKNTDTASVEAQGVPATVDASSVSIEAHPPPGTLTLDLIEEALGASSEDEGSGDDCLDELASGDDYIVDPGDGMVKGGNDLVLALQAPPEGFSTFPPPSTTPIPYKGAWPSIQDVARATRSRTRR